MPNTPTRKLSEVALATTVLDTDRVILLRPIGNEPDATKRVAPLPLTLLADKILARGGNSLRIPLKVTRTEADMRALDPLTCCLGTECVVLEPTPARFVLAYVPHPLAWAYVCKDGSFAQADLTDAEWFALDAPEVGVPDYTSFAAGYAFTPGQLIRATLPGPAAPQQFATRRAPGGPAAAPTADLLPSTGNPTGTDPLWAFVGRGDVPTGFNGSFGNLSGDPLDNAALAQLLDGLASTAYVDGLRTDRLAAKAVVRFANGDPAREFTTYAAAAAVAGPTDTIYLNGFHPEIVVTRPCNVIAYGATYAGLVLNYLASGFAYTWQGGTCTERLFSGRSTGDPHKITVLDVVGGPNCYHQAHANNTSNLGPTDEYTFKRCSFPAGVAFNQNVGDGQYTALYYESCSISKAVAGSLFLNTATNHPLTTITALNCRFRSFDASPLFDAVAPGKYAIAGVSNVDLPAGMVNLAGNGLRVVDYANPFNLPATPQNLYPAGGGGSVPAPASPVLVTEDDAANMLEWTKSSDIAPSGYEVTMDSGDSWSAANVGLVVAGRIRVAVANAYVDAGVIGLRIKATTTAPASAWSFNTISFVPSAAPGYTTAGAALADDFAVGATNGKSLTGSWAGSTAGSISTKASSSANALIDFNFFGTGFTLRGQKYADNGAFEVWLKTGLSGAYVKVFTGTAYAPGYFFAVEDYYVSDPLTANNYSVQVVAIGAVAFERFIVS